LTAFHGKFKFSAVGLFLSLLPRGALTGERNFLNQACGQLSPFFSGADRSHLLRLPIYSSVTDRLLFTSTPPPFFVCPLTVFTMLLPPPPSSLFPSSSSGGGIDPSYPSPPLPQLGGRGRSSSFHPPVCPTPGQPDFWGASICEILFPSLHFEFVFSAFVVSFSLPPFQRWCSLRKAKKDPGFRGNVFNLWAPPFFFPSTITTLHSSPRL